MFFYLIIDSLVCHVCSLEVFTWMINAVCPFRELHLHTAPPGLLLTHVLKIVFPLSSSALLQTVDNCPQNRESPQLRTSPNKGKMTNPMHHLNASGVCFITVQRQPCAILHSCSLGCSSTLGGIPPALLLLCCYGKMP